MVGSLCHGEIRPRAQGCRSRAHDAEGSCKGPLSLPSSWLQTCKWRVTNTLDAYPFRNCWPKVAHGFGFSPNPASPGRYIALLPALGESVKSYSWFRWVSISLALSPLFCAIHLDILFLSPPGGQGTGALDRKPKAESFFAVSTLGPRCEGISLNLRCGSTCSAEGLRESSMVRE